MRSGKNVPPLCACSARVIECCETRLEARPNVQQSSGSTRQFRPVTDKISAAEATRLWLPGHRQRSHRARFAGNAAPQSRALHRGGRCTPALTWHGAGTLHSTSGANYGLFLEVTVYMPRGRGGIGGRNNLQGTAKLCTPQGDTYPLTVRGDLKRAWLDTDGKSVTFYFYSLKGADPRLNFELLGAWHGQELVLEDKGNRAMSFAPDGRAKRYLKGMNSAKENTTGTLHYLTEREFSSVCSVRNENSF
jgi:hypothetical protein